MNWSVRPFVRIFIFLVAGILLAYHLPFIAEAGVFYVSVMVALLAATGFVVYKMNFSWSQAPYLA